MLLTEYAYFLKPGALIYCITDVKELHEWTEERLERHRWFERRTDEENDADQCVAAMRVETEEGKKVARGEGCAGSIKYFCVYRKREMVGEVDLLEDIKNAPVVEERQHQEQPNKKKKKEKELEKVKVKEKEKEETKS